MVRIFDLPPGGLEDGATAVEVNLDGSPIRRRIIGGSEDREILSKPLKPKDPDIKSEVTVTESESEDADPRFATPTPEEPAGSNAGGMSISMRS